MRVHLRHTRTGHYYNGERLWVTVAEEARDYLTPEAATEVVRTERLDGMAMVVLHKPEGPEQVVDLGSPELATEQASAKQPVSHIS